MRYYADLTFQSFYYGEPYTPSLVTLEGETENELMAKVKETIDSWVEYTHTSQTQLGNVKYYQK
jgi:predicted RNase H-like HicB family nuclease